MVCAHGVVKYGDPVLEPRRRTGPPQRTAPRCRCATEDPQQRPPAARLRNREHHRGIHAPL